ILHLTVQKHAHYRLSTTTGKEIDIRLRYPPSPMQGPNPSYGGTIYVGAQEVDSVESTPPLPPRAGSPTEGDYISPGLPSVVPDPFSPQMIVGNNLLPPWPHLRRQIPHHWYVDRRAPTIGFLNRDEAHILYNPALMFSGRPALEIGCW